VTFHGGALLPHVEVQAVFFGSDWATNPTDRQMASQISTGLRTMVSGSYMDMLSSAGYNVGRGSLVGASIANLTLNKSLTLNDHTLQDYLSQQIHSGTWKRDDNSLFVIFVGNNVVVRDKNGRTSQNTFAGYHGVFGYNGQDIRYVVIPYPGGSVHNQMDGAVSVRDSITETASHELVEAVTDPDVNYPPKRGGWVDDLTHQEIVDPVGDSVVYLNGFAVQRVIDKNGKPMTPQGATARDPVTFALGTGGLLYEYNSTGLHLITSNVAEVGEQGIDYHGRAMVDYVTKDGVAFELHEGAGTVRLRDHVAHAAAGQAVSYVSVIQSVDARHVPRNALMEYDDVSRGWTSRDGAGQTIGRIDAGTDRFGVNMVDVIYVDASSDDLTRWTTQAFEISDTVISGTRHWLKLGDMVSWISAGQQGRTEMVIMEGGNLNGYHYRDDNNTKTLIASNVAQMSAGTDANGQPVANVLLKNGQLYVYSNLKSGTLVHDSIKSISKSRAGILDAIEHNGTLDERDANGTWQNAKARNVSSAG
jgi:hypothetical protein